MGVVMEDGADDDILEVEAEAMAVVVAVAVDDDANVDEDDDEEGPPPTKKVKTNSGKGSRAKSTKSKATNMTARKLPIKKQSRLTIRANEEGKRVARRSRHHNRRNKQCTL